MAFFLNEKNKQNEHCIQSLTGLLHLVEQGRKKIDEKVTFINYALDSGCVEESRAERSLARSDKPPLKIIIMIMFS